MPCECGPDEDCAACEPMRCGNEGFSDYGTYADGSTHWVPEACNEALCEHGKCPSCDECNECEPPPAQYTVSPGANQSPTDDDIPF